MNIYWNSNEYAVVYVDIVNSNEDKIYIVTNNKEKDFFIKRKFI